MSNEEIRELEHRVERIAYKMGFVHEYKDLTQQVFLNWLRHPTWKQTIKFAIVDAARQTIHKGRKRVNPIFIPLEELDLERNL